MDDEEGMCTLYMKKVYIPMCIAIPLCLLFDVSLLSLLVGIFLS